MNNSKLLDFTKGNIDKLPETFNISLIEETNPGLKVICGPGDYVHFGVTNVQKYKDYDVFCCLGDSGLLKETSPDHYTSVQENLDYLNANNLNKLLCIIDVSNIEQTSNFSKLFGDKCILVSHQDVHSPIFYPDTCFKILKPGGIVALKSTEGIGEGFFDKTYWRNKDGTQKFKCKVDTFTEPGTNRVYQGLKICVRKDYSPDLFGGKKRKTYRKKSNKRKTLRVKKMHKRNT